MFRGRPVPGPAGSSREAGQPHATRPHKSARAGGSSLPPTVAPPGDTGPEAGSGVTKRVTRYERVRKDVLADPTYTDAEFRAALYLAGKPPGWVVHPEVMARELSRSLSWAERTLTRLRKRGLVTVTEVRSDAGVITRRDSELDRAQVVAEPVTAGQHQRAISAHWLRPGETTQNRRSAPARTFTSAGESALLEITERPTDDGLKDDGAAPPPPVPSVVTPTGGRLPGEVRPSSEETRSTPRLLRSVPVSGQALTAVG